MPPTTSIAIIGAGMGGLAAGVYGRLNDYETHIFEAHSLPGGQCTGWKRRGYTFDACIHHLFGCNESSALHRLWEELGVMPRELVPTQECSAVSAPDGRLFRDYYDLDLLREHMLELSPADAAVIGDYVHGIRSAAKADFIGRLMMSGPSSLVPLLPALLPSFKWFRPTMAEVADRFTDPFLRRAFALLVYSMPDIPAIIHLARHGYGLNGSLKWPIGGARELAASLERRFESLGGRVHYNSRVEEILVRNDRAVGVRTADGVEHPADIVISDADGRRTIMELLRGRYTDARTRMECAAPPDETNWALHVFLGVDRDLTAEPSALVMLLDDPLTIAGHECRSLEMQLYGHDPTMAPQGKGVIKVELSAGYRYWKSLAADQDRYREEKRKVADQVIDALETRFLGLRSQVETVDVPTLLTWERFMGGTHGFANMPNRKLSIMGSMSPKGWTTRLPGLDGFYQVGAWATMAGALFANALSGRVVVGDICRADGRRFVTT